MLIVKERNPNYKGIADITSALRAYYASYQRGHAFARAEKMCSHCGSLAQEIHHIYPMFKIIEDEIATNVEFDLATEAGRFGLVAKVIDNKGNVFNDEDNLIAVCKNCHDTIYHGSGWKSEYNDIDNQQPSQFALEGSETIETARYA
jgi:5-methylcytosine-specific restriction endonuclease McrA